MALYLLSRVLLRPGDVVAVEDPGYPWAVALFREAGARVVPLPVDGGGLDLAALRALLEARELRALLVTPHHQFPTTSPLAIERRLELLELARRHRFAIIEDDFDHDFHYEGRPILPMASIDTAGVVVYLGSLSKLLAPGLRIGFVVAPRALVTQLRQARYLIDFQNDQVLDHAIAELAEDGELQRHVNRARGIYRQRRDHLVEVLRRELGEVLELAVPAGGMAIWATAPGVDVDAWARRARAAGLIFRTGGFFFADGRTHAALRLGFARMDEAELTRAAALLGRSLRRRK
jgi:GntR family transcriptional regulator/MocR family aminotransferase